MDKQRKEFNKKYGHLEQYCKERYSTSGLQEKKNPVVVFCEELPSSYSKLLRAIIGFKIVVANNKEVEISESRLNALDKFVILARSKREIKSEGDAELAIYIGESLSNMKYQIKALGVYQLGLPRSKARTLMKDLLSYTDNLNNAKSLNEAREIFDAFKAEIEHKHYIIAELALERARHSSISSINVSFTAIKHCRRNPFLIYFVKRMAKKCISKINKSEDVDEIEALSGNFCDKADKLCRFTLDEKECWD